MAPPELTNGVRASVKALRLSSVWHSADQRSHHLVYGSSREKSRQSVLEGYFLLKTCLLDSEATSNFLILDDDQSLQGLERDRKEYWIRTDPLVGFNRVKLEEAKMKTKNWN